MVLNQLIATVGLRDRVYRDQDTVALETTPAVSNPGFSLSQLVFSSVSLPPNPVESTEQD